MDRYHNKALITLSYDDGRRNNYDIALPVHEAFKIPASFAIIANRAVDPDHWGRHMTPKEIVDANKRGVEITSHGVMHRAKFTDLSAEELEFELRESRRILEGFTGGDQPVDTLCLPFSASNKTVRTETAKHYAITRGHGGRLNDPLDDNGYVTSYGLRNSSTFTEIQELIDEAISKKKWLVLMLHGVVAESYADRKYDISVSLLKEILAYLDELGDNLIKPVSFSEIIKLRNELTVSKKPLKPSITDNRSYTLADAPGYLITYHKSNQEADTVVISFGGLPSKKTPTGFGSKFILKQGYDHIFVAQEAGSQYQELSLDEFRDAVQPYIEGKKVFTYGSSLGAYAALYYGGAVDAAIIASAPKNSAHPSMRKAKYSDIEFKHSELSEVPKSTIPPLVLFDPYREEESQFIEKWVTPAYSDAHLLQLPYAGHTVLNTMKESGVLKKFINTYVQKGEVISFKLREEDSYIWHAEKGRKLLKNERFGEARRHFEKSLELRQNGDAASGLVRALLKENQPDTAQQVISNHFNLTGGYKGISAGLRNSVEKKRKNKKF